MGEETMIFPKEYHAAFEYLVRFGLIGGDARIGRLKIAAALRATKSIDPNCDPRYWAKVCYRELFRIAGGFPLNPNVAIRNHAVKQW